MGVSLDTQLARNSSLYAHHAERHFLNYCPVTWLSKKVHWTLRVEGLNLHEGSTRRSGFRYSFLDGSSPQASSRIDQYGVVVV
jgi:hypothetical protein